jgi:two-component system, OmpR family, heavy metal sensor histidine kinase CusS
LNQHFAEMDEDELRVISGSVLQALSELRNTKDPEVLQRAVRGHHGVHYYVVDAAGQVLYMPTNGPDLTRLVKELAPIELRSPLKMSVWEESGRHYRGAVMHTGSDYDPNDLFTIAVAIEIDTHLVFIESFKRIQWWTLCIVMCIAILVVFGAVRWGHLPIHRANEKISRITTSRLDIRLEANEVPIELAETITSFNKMLDRIQEGYSRVASVSADIAHELRTPVTNMSTQTEVALGQPRSEDEYREILYSNLEEFRRLGRMINDMLFLAQTENTHDSLLLVHVDLKRVIDGLFEYFEAWVEECGVSLRLCGDPPVITADLDMLRRAISNLLSNAIRYTPRGGTVTVRTLQEKGIATISVENNGPKISPDELPLIFTRFYRGDPARTRQTDGAGLGLSIVKTIVDVHGGNVRAESDDHLTRFVIELPILQPKYDNTNS